MFEVFDHTADLGLRISATDRNELFAEAGRALLSVIVSNPDAIEPRDKLAIHITGEDREYLFFDWLHELLFLFESQQFLAATFELTVSEDELTAIVRGEIYDPTRHVLAHEVKAVTYHGLTVEETGEGWRAEVILDI